MFLLQHQLCESLQETEHQICWFLPSTGLSHPRIHLCHGQEEGELTIGPPLSPPSTLQQNWGVAMFVNVVHPMLPLLCLEND
jgi:hypothetical protein